jgi:histone H3/H4
MKTSKFSLYDIEQFIREAGAERVTEDAVRALDRELEKLAETVTRRAKMNAEHAGRRKLIGSADVKLTHMSLFADYSTPESLSTKASMTKASSSIER